MNAYCCNCPAPIDPESDNPYCLLCFIEVMAYLDDLDAEYIDAHHPRWVEL